MEPEAHLQVVEESLEEEEYLVEEEYLEEGLLTVNWAEKELLAAASAS